MKYFVMDTSYGWVSVSAEIYHNVPDDMIGNKAKVDNDGLVEIHVMNIMQDELVGLVDLLKT
jgi:hypothetical protein